DVLSGAGVHLDPEALSGVDAGFAQVGDREFELRVCRRRIEGESSTYAGERSTEAILQQVRRTVDFGNAEPVDPTTNHAFVAGNSSDQGGGTRNGRIVRVERRECDCDCFVAAHVGTVDASHRRHLARGTTWVAVSVGVAEDRELAGRVLESGEPNVQRVVRAAVAHLNVIDRPARNPTVGGDERHFANVARAVHHRDRIGIQIAGDILGAKVLLNVAGERDWTGESWSRTDHY